MLRPGIFCAFVYLIAIACSVALLLKERRKILNHIACGLLLVALVLLNFVFSDWRHLPWRLFNDPLTQWGVMPSFLSMEWVFMALFVATLKHALNTNILGLWFSAGICGTANEY